MLLSNSVYNFMKKLVTIILPAMGSMYFALDAIWDLPAEEKVVGTLAVVATFLGVILGISSSKYNTSEAAFDGKVLVTHNAEGGTLYSLELNDDPVGLEQMSSVRFKVSQE